MDNHLSRGKNRLDGAKQDAQILHPERSRRNREELDWQSAYARWATDYDRSGSNPLTRLAYECLDSLDFLCAESLVLDIGSGTGRSSRWALGRGAKAVICMDGVREMLQAMPGTHARQDTNLAPSHEGGIRENTQDEHELVPATTSELEIADQFPVSADPVEYEDSAGSRFCVQGKAECLPFSAGSFDRAVSVLMLGHLPTKGLRLFLHEARRVLSPQGEFVLVGMHADAHGAGWKRSFRDRRSRPWSVTWHAHKLEDLTALASKAKLEKLESAEIGFRNDHALAGSEGSSLPPEAFGTKAVFAIRFRAIE